ncbi:MAG TPA: hypothetical protein VLM75_11380 [Spirochaetota bacterium]|nr:hypothetical protein [Spirochaetota bacterium]
MRKAALACALLVSLCGAALSAPPSEKEYLARIRALAEKREADKLRELAAEFYRTWPQSDAVADVRLFVADVEESPDEAIRQYRILLDKYRYFKKRDLAALRICETLYLCARWEELAAESARAEATFPKSMHLSRYMLYRAKALIHLERYDEARAACRRATETNRNYNALADVLLVLAYVERKSTGYSRAYLHSLRELITGFPDAPAAPAALYLLGRFYENRADYGRAYSAYDDLMRRHPRAVESGFAAGRMVEVKAHNPRPLPYLPEDAAIRGAEELDIRPEMETGQIDDDADITYAIALGPFHSRADAKRVLKIISGEFAPIQEVSVAGRHLVYVGRARDTDSAISLKIRLAEEFAINGNIVRIRKDENRRYIYGD